MSKISLRPKTVNYVTYPFVFWDGFFTEEELKTLENYCYSQGVQPAEVIGKDGIAFQAAERKSKAQMHTPNENNLWIFEKLKGLTEFINDEFYQYDLNGFDYFQYTEYDGDGSHYDYHVDMMFGENIPVGMEIPRKLSFSLVLSDNSEYTGGEFQLMIDVTGAKVAEQKRGRIIAFPSYIMHRVTPVTSGKRRSIVFWAIGPKFK
jgi:PKHD-type hydroxylase